MAELEAWANLAIRWLHLVAGIAWIGSSFYFMWLDSHLKKPPNAPDGIAGELWSVHSGGFYRQMKFMVAPADMPDDLHWFKWEAYTTWISGFLLLSLIFYVGADLNLIDKTKADLPTWQAIALGLGSLVVGWAVYDGLCRSPIGQNLRLFSAVWFTLLVAAGYGLTRIFSDLGAFMHVGAIIGTVMAANVFMIIIPNQRKVIAQVLAGEAPDPALGKQAKQRSVHNNYMTPPVLFIMISNHYPMIFAAPLNWLWLAGLGIAGWTIRHFFNLRNAGRFEPQVLAAGALVFSTVAVLNEAARPQPAIAERVPTYAEVRAIVDKHCVMCHAAHPTHRGVPVAPNGAMFDTAEGLEKHAEKIYARAVATESMPQGNETGMTPAERASLGAWIKAGGEAVRTVTPEPLTADAFAPFGDVIEASGDAEIIPINYGWTTRFNALTDVNVGDGRAIISLFRSKPLEPLILRIFERHPDGSQAFMPLQGRPYLVAVAPPGDFDAARVRVFRATASQGVNYAKGTWHHFLLAQEAESDFLVVDRDSGPGENLDEIELPEADWLVVR